MVTSSNQRVAPYIDNSNIDQRWYYSSVLNDSPKYHSPKGVYSLEEKELSLSKETSPKCIGSPIHDNKYNEFSIDRDSNESNIIAENKRKGLTSSIKSFTKRNKNILYSEIKDSYTAIINDIMDESASINWFDIPKEIKFNIFLFLTPDEIKGWDRESYTLACSRQVWKQHLYNTWSYLFHYEKEGYHLQFGFENLSTNGFCNKINKINFKMLYALSTSYPSQMDTSIFSLTTNNICFKKYEIISSTNCCATTKRRLQVYQLYSSTWLNDVCICSDLPFPIQNQVLSSSSSSTSLASCLFSCFPQRAVQPFVAPFATKLDYSNRTTTLEMSLSPRFVAYYEVTLLQRDKTQEPNCPNTVARYSSALECVAIGLSLRTSIKERKMPGWDNDSYGYHGDDGGIFHNKGQMLRNYGPTFTNGDTVGCGIDYIENATRCLQ